MYERQGGQTYYQQLPANSFGSYMAPAAGAGNYSHQQPPTAAATAVVSQSAPVNVPLASQPPQGIFFVKKGSMTD